MLEAITFLAPALMMCVVIASIHVYLGMHILERDIIFVDLSLAQLAALGAIVVSLVDHDGGGLTTNIGAFGFSVLGAAVFALSGRARHHVSQEAVVGIVYAVASALMILVLSQAAHGAERIKDALVGALLVVTWAQVWKTALIYVVLGIVLWRLAKRFVQISWHRNSAEQSLPNLVWWDFAFYALFGVVITISVQIAGVLLVFSMLIVPAVITGLFTKHIMFRLLGGWAVALLASLAGLWGSWRWDFPTGATVVVAFGISLIAAAVVKVLQERAKANRGLLR